MSNTTKNSILILDDDPSFRSLVANLLRPHGYNVVEASSPAEANAMFSKKETVLAIVDYRLPQMDGMTWITHLREAGGTTPIVFCSAVPCDAKTFSWLRNILGVALIVQKPIIPASFLQQIESLLPGYKKSFDHEGIAAVSSKPKKVDEESDAQVKEDINKLAKKLKIEQAINQAKLEYYEQLDNDWKVLVSRIEDRNNDPNNEDAVIDAIRIAHSIRGTAGSLGLEEIGLVAGKLEDFLLSLDPYDATDQEIYWSEIVRAVARGNELIEKTLSESREPAQSSASNRVLILSQRASVIEASKEKETREIAHVQGTESPAAFIKYATENRIDAVIIDSSNNVDGAMRDAAKVRSIPGNESIPIGIIRLNKESLTNSDLLYIGSSSTITGSVDGESLRNCIKDLLKIIIPGRPRVLVVDDDEVLCKFAAGVLADQHMDTEYETSPIKVKDRMEHFNPDLVLLDVMMPLMTGYEVCRQIRAEKRWNDVPVLFLTSKTSQEARAAAFAVGANDFLTKPILTEELVARVASQLALASRKRKDRARDPETRMLTGAAFMTEAGELLKSFKEGNQPFSVALIEIDDFDMTTVVQGFHGAHGAANELGDLLKERFSAESLRCKWSNSGYAIVVPGAGSGELGNAIERILKDFSDIKFTGTVHKFSTSFSAGIASSKEDGDNLEDIIRAAHHKLKAGKREKSGAVSVS